MSLTLEMRKRQDGFHQQSRHLQTTGGQYPFQHSFFLYFLREHLLLHSHGSNFRPPLPLPAFGYTSSLARLPVWLCSHPTDVNELNIFASFFILQIHAKFG
jgi:hypothetical protein